MSAAPPRLLAITDGASEGLDPWLDDLAAAGVDTLQLRAKELPDRLLFERLVAIRRRLPAAVRVLVNGRPDLALAAHADGVHLPAAGLPSAAARRLLGPDRLLGRSCHTPEEVARAAREHRDGLLDYAVFGPLYPTPGKPEDAAVPGPEGLRAALARAASLPLLALGGIDRLERVAEALRLGAHGVAAIRLFETDRRGLEGIVARTPPR